MSDFDNPRAVDMIHYLISQDSNQTLTAVKINKVLFYSDLVYFLDTGTTISNERGYIKMPLGMVMPYMPARLAELEKDKKIEINKEKIVYYLTTKYKAIVENRGDQFDDKQKEIINNVLEFSKNHTASDMSKMNHDEVWAMVDDREKIPFFAFTAKSGLLTKEQNEWAISEINEHLKRNFI